MVRLFVGTLFVSGCSTIADSQSSDVFEALRTASPVAEAEVRPVGIAADGKGVVVWAAAADDGNGALRTTAPDGTPRTLVSSAIAPREIALDGDDIYWTAFAGAEPNAEAGTVFRAGPDDGEARALAEGVEGLRDLVVDATHVWLATTEGVARLEKDGGEYTLVVPTERPVLRLAQDEAHVFWREGQPIGSVRGVAKSDGEAFTISPDVDSDGIFVQQGFLFFADRGRLHIASLEDRDILELGASEVDTVAELVGDREALYYTDASRQRIFRFGFEMGWVETFVGGQWGAQRLVLTEEALFWTDLAQEDAHAGRVMTAITSLP
ncbi:MAG: hypothetical protein AAGA56_07655 [Myxococcota bacterium]